MSLEAGEICALLGENGSGKSTLVKMMYGLVKPDEGEMIFQSSSYSPSNPHEARAAGIAMVFQHFSLFDALTVAENISLGMVDPPSSSKLSKKIEEKGKAYGLSLNPDSLVGSLSAGERQRVEIIRCLLQNPKILIMDEPTSVLTPQEADVLFEALTNLAAEGTTILYISHKLEEIKTLCTKATILRAGKVVATCNPKEKSARQLAELMVGTSIGTPKRVEVLRDHEGTPLLKVIDIEKDSPSNFGTSLRRISFEVWQGEVFGIGGIAGNGQDELMEVLSGEALPQNGSILLNGTDLAKLTPNERRKRGLLFAPEQRVGHSAAGEMSLTENSYLTAADRKNLSRYGIIDWPKTVEFSQTIIKQFDVRTPGTENFAQALSGGNLQKFVIGREILQDPQVLIVNQPTWGVDAAAAASIRQKLMDLADRGAAVVVISQDIDELLEISDYVSVLSGGSLSKERPVQELTREDIGLMMGASQEVSLEA